MKRIKFCAGLALAAALLLMAPFASAQVFSGSTGSVISSSATPVFSLAAISSQSPIVFTISPTVNVTGPTITNKVAGARFAIIVTSDGTHTWSWNSIISDNVCPVYTDAVAKTYASFVVDPDGTTVHGEDCWFNIPGAVAYGATVSAASSNPSSGNMICMLTANGLDCLSSGGTHSLMCPGLTANSLVVGGGSGTCPSALGQSFSTLTDSATVTWAIGSAVSASADLTFTAHSGSRTLNITGPATTGVYVLWIKQDSTGGEGLTLGTGCTWKVANGGGGAVTPSTGANAIDVLTFTYDGTNCYATFNKNFN